MELENVVCQIYLILDFQDSPFIPTYEGWWQTSTLSSDHLHLLWKEIERQWQVCSIKELNLWVNKCTCSWHCWLQPEEGIHWYVLRQIALIWLLYYPLLVPTLKMLEQDLIISIWNAKTNATVNFVATLYQHFSVVFCCHFFF